jgi:hypothetical protein
MCAILGVCLWYCDTLLLFPLYSSPQTLPLSHWTVATLLVTVLLLFNCYLRIDSCELILSAHTIVLANNSHSKDEGFRVRFG